MFFAGGASLPYVELLARVSDRSRSIRALIDATHVGGLIPEGELTRLLVSVTDPATWSLYAASGPPQAEWVVRHYSGSDPEPIQVTLRMLPSKVIPLLLGLGGDYQDGPGWKVQEPLKVLSDWVRDLSVGEEEMAIHRMLLIRLSRKCGKEFGERAARAGCLALSLRLESSVSDPGAGRTITIRRGILPQSVRRRVSAEWETVLTLINEFRHESWDLATQLVGEWSAPESTVPGVVVADVEREEMLDFARRMFNDLSHLAVNEPALLRRLSNLAEDINCEIPADPDPDFAILYPVEHYDADWQEEERQQKNAVEDLAADWQTRAPTEVVQRLIAIERAASAAELSWPRFSPTFCERLSALVNTLVEYTELLIAEAACADLVHPFLLQLRDQDRPEWPAIAESMIQDDRYSGIAFMVALTSPVLPTCLNKPLLATAPIFTVLIEVDCLKGLVSAPVVQVLLGHPNPLVAFAAASGMFRGTAPIPVDLCDIWHEAVLATADVVAGELRMSSSATHSLGRILSSDGQLSLDWLMRRVGAVGFNLHAIRGSPSAHAIESLGNRQRKDLLDSSHIEKAGTDAIRLIVGNDLGLFRDLLRREELHDFHLAPLAGHPNDDWCARASITLDAGFTARDIIFATLETNKGGLAFWSYREKGFERLLEADDDRIRELGQEGVDFYGARRMKAELRAREEELRGFGQE